MSDTGGDKSTLQQNSNGSGPWGGGGNRGNGGDKGPWGGSNNGNANRGSGSGQGPWGGGTGNNNGGGNQNNGGGGSNANVEELFNRARRNIGGGGGGNGGNGRSSGGLPGNLPIPLLILAAIIGLGFVWWNAGGVRLVNPSQQLVVTFLGQYQTTKGEGLQIQPLAPLQRSYVINVLQQRETPVGARGNRPDVSAIIERRNQRLAQNNARATSTTTTLTEEDFVEPNVVLQELQAETRGGILNQNLILTNEGKIADVDVNVFWNVKDARDFLFNVKDPTERFGGLNSVDPTETIKLAAEAALRSAVATRDLDAVVDRTGLAIDIETQLQALLDEYGAGINVVRVDVPYAQPPLAVLPSYNAVKNAEKTKNEIINKAQAEATRVTNEAQGTVDKVLQEATAFKNETVAAARGEAERFTQVLSAYDEAPGVTVQRLYLDTMKEVFAKADTTIVDSSLGGDSLPLLPLSPLNQ